MKQVKNERKIVMRNLDESLNMREQYKRQRENYLKCNV